MKPIRSAHGRCRRTFLKSVGVSLTLPWMESLPASAPDKGKASGNPKPRFACIYVPNGVNIMKWMPDGSGTDYAMSPTLKCLEPHRRKFSVLSGLGHPNSRGGHAGADTFLTGADLEATPGYDYRNSISIDQVAAEVTGLETRFPSLELSSDGGTGKPGHSHTLAFSRNAVPLPTEKSPRAVFERLFVDDSDSSRAAMERRFREDRSILDTVLEQVQSLNRRLPANDRDRLDDYLTSVREVEKRVIRAESWMDVPRESIPEGDLKLGARPYERGDRQSWIRTMYDLMFLAFQTDSARVSTFQIGREASGGYYSELGLNANHHELSHHGGDESMLDGLFRIDSFLLEQFGYFMTRLSEYSEGDTSLLDQTMIVYGSGMNSGEGGGHSPKNLPLLFAGGGALGIRQGAHHAFDDSSTGSVPLSNLYLTIIRSMGIDLPSFQDSTGVMSQLIV